MNKATGPMRERARIPAGGYLLVLIVLLFGICVHQAGAADRWDPDFIGKMGQDVYKQNKGAGFVNQWYVFCNKTGTSYNNQQGGRIELGKKQPNGNYIRMAGPFNNEPDARNWANNSCRSWRCDWNGRCVNAPAGGGGSGGNDGCPPGTYRDMGVFGQGSGKCIAY